MKRFAWYSVSAVLLLGLSVGAYASICLKDKTNLEIGALLNSTAPSADGTVHITYSASGDPNAANMMAAAAAGWNAQSGVTGITFVPAAAGQAANIVMNSNTNSASGGCASMNPTNGTLNYTLGLASTFTANPAANNPTVMVLEHEMGHFLGLNEQKPDSAPGVMDQGQACPPANTMSNTAPPDQVDASEAQNCSSQAKCKCNQ